MKRLIAGLASFLLPVFLCGCFLAHTNIRDEVGFYYPRREFTYQTDAAVMDRESRDMAGHVNDPKYLLRMYLLGPSNTELAPAFPPETKLLSYQETPDSANLVLSDEGAEMSDIQFTLACACISRTLTELRNIGQITILRGTQSITLSTADLILVDTARTQGGTQ